VSIIRRPLALTTLPPGNTWVTYLLEAKLLPLVDATLTDALLAMIMTDALAIHMNLVAAHLDTMTATEEETEIMMIAVVAHLLLDADAHLHLQLVALHLLLATRTLQEKIVIDQCIVHGYGEAISKEV